MFSANDGPKKRIHRPKNGPVPKLAVNSYRTASENPLPLVAGLCEKLRDV